MRLIYSTIFPDMSAKLGNVDNIGEKCKSPLFDITLSTSLIAGILAHLMKKIIIILPLMAFLSGCPVWQDQDTPVEQFRSVEPETGRAYWIYVPSYYKADQSWPLVVTLHGTYVWESYERQIKEWKKLAEEEGFIVVAPKLRAASVQGILPVAHDTRMAALRDDETMILALINSLSDAYNIDNQAVMITGFSGGGLPAYYAALNNPTRFHMLILRSCNSDIKQFEEVTLTDEAKKLPIYIYWGKDDFQLIQDQSWQGFRYLKERSYEVEKKEIKGGHIRRPKVAMEYWKKHLPAKYCKSRR